MKFLITSMLLMVTCAVAQQVNPEDSINVPGMGDRPARRMSRQTLAAVVEPRYDELFTLVMSEIDRSGFMGKLSAGIVLTGGSAKIEEATALAESIFHMPVRIGMPQSLKVGGMGEVLRNPIYSTGVGLLMYGRKKYLDRNIGQEPARRSALDAGEFVQKLRGWLARNF